jgi:ABC-2 type transport system permease protein
MNGNLRPTLRNIGIVARREFLWRGRSRAFLISTLFLVVVAVAVALAPTIVRFVDRLDIGETIGVQTGAAAPSIAYARALEALLASTDMTATAPGGTTEATSPYTVVEVSDLSAAREDVRTGKLKAVLALERTSSGDLGYTLYTDMMPFERTTQLIRQAATALAIQDRLTRAGVPPGDQDALFAPTAFAVVKADPSGAPRPDTVEQLIGGSVIGFALTIFIFMAILMYGQWVAMSVAEEKSSRVMEIILGAARPVELMTGKVLGVGGLALTQYAIVFVPVALVVLFEGAIAALVLGGNATVELPKGLSVSLLVGFGIFFVLGFLLYATLYAGVASLVSRQEDVNQIIGPLTLISTLGYLVAVWISSGLIELESPLVRILSYVPFLSPYIMVSRMATGQVEPWEIGIAVFILVISIGIALWASARVYAAGVLLYGQKPGVRVFIQAFRNG